MAQIRGEVRSTTSLLLIACSLAAWLVTIVYTVDMPAAPGTMGLDVVQFVGLWTVMMAAMMLPSVSPLVSLYLHRIRSEPSGLVRARRTSALVAGYLAAWSCFGVV